jgi:arginine utilization regulatory protein
MLKLKTLAFKASQTDSPVLIGGSTGTGKELFVHAIHNASNRKDYPFIAQNCAALPANLLESILFGSVKGSFTGANDRPGLFELADGGTLFLDEINSMPLELQAKLLRVLQDKKIRRVGGAKTIDVDVRIVAAYNSNLKEALDKKQLRRDLFYRLNVISMIVPDLKDRKDDLPILLDYFIEKYNKKNKKFIKEVSDTVMNIFMKYDWPGNVRELEHVIEGISSIYDIDIIREEHLPYHFIEDNPITNGSSKIEPLNKALERKEKELIFTALNKTDGNVTRAAELLEIPRQTLQYRIKKFDIQP